MVNVPEVGAVDMPALASVVAAAVLAAVPSVALLRVEVAVARLSTFTLKLPLAALALAVAVATVVALELAVLPMVLLCSSRAETADCSDVALVATSW